MDIYQLLYENLTFGFFASPQLGMHRVKKSATKYSHQKPGVHKKHNTTKNILDLWPTKRTNYSSNWYNWVLFKMNKNDLLIEYDFRLISKGQGVISLNITQPVLVDLQ